MEIKSINNTDINSIIELIELFRKEQERILSSEDKKKIEISLLNIMNYDNSEIFIVKENNNRLIGYIAFHIIDFPLLAGKECYISDLLINPSSRGKGLGRKLIEKVESYSKKLGVKRLMLNNHKTEKSYISSFYQKIGFSERVDFANFVK